MTVTKTCLEVLKQLGNAFSNAMEAKDKTSTATVAPYILKNETGLAITLDMERSNFKLAESENAVQSSGAYAEVILESGASIELMSKIKTEIHLLQQLKADTVKEQSLNKFFISVISKKLCYIQILNFRLNIFSFSIAV